MGGGDTLKRSPSTRRVVKEEAPFGNPDGSRADIEEVLKGFVDFGGSAVWGGLGMKSNDLSARVIVGRKGSGKTVYLRRLQAAADDQDSVYADHIQQSLPTTENIIKFCQFFEEHILTEKWMLLWHRAILRSVVSHLLNHPSLRQVVSIETMERLSEDYSELLRNFGTPMSIYSQVTEIIGMHDTAHIITRFLENPLWEELEARVANIIRECPPLYFFVDAVDEEFSHAPMYWHRCQKGLFYTTMRFLRDSKLGGRLHIVICVRDIVLSSVYRSEHRSRYYGEPHIKLMNWNNEAASYFLYEKIKMLDNRFFIGDPKSGKDIRTWLGTDTIHNVVRDIDEPVETYLLRHTRLLPRDIVILGNSLCREVLQHKSMHDDHSLEDAIRTTVAEVARFLGGEQLIICGNLIASDQVPTDAARYEYSDVYTSSQEYVRGIADRLATLLNSIGKEEFSYDELTNAQQYAHELFGNDSDAFTALWQNGLVGYSETADTGEKIKFYNEFSLADFNIPLRKGKYVFHSSLIDSVGIKPVRKLPVRY